MYTRVRDCFNRPICSVPGGEIDLLDRESDDCNWTFRFETPKSINVVRSIAPKPFPILDQNMWFSIPYFEPYPAKNLTFFSAENGIAYTLHLHVCCSLITRIFARFYRLGTLERKPRHWIFRLITTLGSQRILGLVQKPLNRRSADTVWRDAAQGMNMVSLNW